MRKTHLSNDEPEQTIADAERALKCENENVALDIAIEATHRADVAEAWQPHYERVAKIAAAQAATIAELEAENKLQALALSTFIEESDAKGGVDLEEVRTHVKLEAELATVRATLVATTEASAKEGERIASLEAAVRSMLTNEGHIAECGPAWDECVEPQCKELRAALAVGGDGA